MPSFLKYQFKMYNFKAWGFSEWTGRLYHFNWKLMLGEMMVIFDSTIEVHTEACIVNHQVQGSR